MISSFLAKIRFTALIGAAIGVATAQPAAADEGAARLHLGELQLRVLYRDTGRLSDDLLHGDGPRATWNLVIGGGGLEGPADDAVVLLPIIADKDETGNGEAFSDTPIAIRARDAKERVIAHREFTGVLTSGEGKTHLALWLTDVTCQAPLTLEATLGKERVTGRFDFNCGE